MKSFEEKKKKTVSKKAHVSPKVSATVASTEEAARHQVLNKRGGRFGKKWFPFSKQ